MAQEQASAPALLPEAIRRRLEPLMLVARKVRAGAIKGDRRSVKRGSSIEFADYRNYAAGDDLRQLDWNIYARLERPYIKLLEDEEDLAVHLILDASASMDFPPEGEPDQHKLTCAKRILAGLAYISLTSNDRLVLTAVNGQGAATFGPTRGRARGIAALGFIADIAAAGITDLDAALDDYALRAHRPGLTLVLSDMFSYEGRYLDGLNALLSRGHEVAFVHVLAPEEVRPQATGDLSLIDIETETKQEVTLDGAMRGLYQRRVAAWRDEIRDECLRRGAHYFPLVTDAPWERLILSDMRRVGLVK
ncbi:MAG: DUF58 domain-containing protein [Chloroflexota bacterium]|nr:DUF58 domain-containing protein [Chloroflexota bacterium]MDE2947462.1 DUF58 domain-containing protein [Chloroflexota bacterium]